MPRGKIGDTTFLCSCGKKMNFCDFPQTLLFACHCEFLSECTRRTHFTLYIFSDTFATSDLTLFQARHISSSPNLSPPLPPPPTAPWTSKPDYRQVWTTRQPWSCCRRPTAKLQRRRLKERRRPPASARERRSTQPCRSSRKCELSLHLNQLIMYCLSKPMGFRFWQCS